MPLLCHHRHNYHHGCVQCRAKACPMPLQSFLSCGELVRYLPANFFPSSLYGVDGLPLFIIPSLDDHLPYYVSIQNILLLLNLSYDAFPPSSFSDIGRSFQGSPMESYTEGLTQHYDALSKVYSLALSLPITKHYSCHLCTACWDDLSLTLR